MTKKLTDKQKHCLTRRHHRYPIFTSDRKMEHRPYFHLSEDKILRIKQDSETLLAIYVHPFIRPLLARMMLLFSDFERETV